MSEYKSDELFLKGRIQVETAREALTHTGINPSAEQRLQTFLDVHSQLSDKISQQDLVIYLRGGVVAAEKADIIASLEAMSADDTISVATRLAATALRHII
ncbi:MAG TPA: hypothetical protein VFM68_03590 [Candidatus Saccharimonadales bacterium]|nr:hypothetical protein [Candidatus Saccharimonadales bacterium]